MFEIIPFDRHIRHLAAMDPFREFDELERSFLHEEAEEGEIEYDEHVWTSPRNAMEICRTLCRTLCSLDPDGAALYRTNCENYCAQLEELDAAFRRIVRHSLMTSS